jgi:hypothetical protein
MKSADGGGNPLTDPVEMGVRGYLKAGRILRAHHRR